MTDLSPLGRAHLRKNALIYGDEVLVAVLDALDAALTERDELRDALVNRIFTDKTGENSTAAISASESKVVLRSGSNGL